MAEDAIESADQAPDDAPQAEAAVPDESTDFIEEVAAGVEESVEPEAVVDDAPEAVRVTDESPEPVRLTREQLREQYAEELAVERNAAVQSELARLRRETGNEAATSKYLKERAAELGVTVDDDRIHNALKTNREWGASQVFSQLGEAAVASLGVDGVEREALLRNVNSLDPEENRLGAMQLVELATERIGVPRGRQEILNQTIDDIPADSTLAKSALARENARLESELKAADLEAKPKRDPAPATPGGRVAGTDNFDLTDPIQVVRANRAGRFASDAEAAAALNRAFNGS